MTKHVHVNLNHTRAISNIQGILLGLVPMHLAMLFFYTLHFGISVTIFLLQQRETYKRVLCISCLGLKVIQSVGATQPAAWA